MGLPNAIIHKMSIKKDFRDVGYEQLISNGGRFKPTFVKRAWKQTMIDLQGVSTSCFKNKLCPSIRLSRLWAQ
jgi:hypothetical protein